eukprot:523747_1
MVEWLLSIFNIFDNIMTVTGAIVISLLLLYLNTQSQSDTTSTNLQMPMVDVTADNDNDNDNDNEEQKEEKHNAKQKELTSQLFDYTDLSTTDNADMLISILKGLSLDINCALNLEDNTKGNKFEIDEIIDDYKQPPTDMVKAANFSGIWELISIDNAENYMKSEGMGYMRRKLLQKLSLTYSLEHHENEMKLHAKFLFGSFDIEYSLDGKVKETLSPMEKHKTRLNAIWFDDRKQKIIIKTHDLITNKKTILERWMPNKNELYDTITNEKKISMTRRFKRKKWY